MTLRWGRLRPIGRFAKRAFLYSRFRLFQHLRYDRLVLEHIDGRPLLVLPQVFNPALFESSVLLAHTLEAEGLQPETAVLDLGTGSGLSAIVAAQRSHCVTASDINPEAVRCAKINALLNRSDERVEAVCGDLFATVSARRFDVIVFNPPFFRGTPRTPLDHAWRSTNVIERFAAELCEHLAPRGFALVVYSSDGDTPALLRAFEQNGLAVEVAVRRDVISEVLTVYRVSVP